MRHSYKHSISMIHPTMLEAGGDRESRILTICTAKMLNLYLYTIKKQKTFCLHTAMSSMKNIFFVKVI